MTSQQSIPVADIYPFDTAAAPSSRLFQRLDVILHSVRSHLDKQDTLSGQHRQGEIQKASQDRALADFCALRLQWTPDARRVLTGSTSGEFTLWNGLTFNFETILQVRSMSTLRTMSREFDF